MTNAIAVPGDSFPVDFTKIRPAKEPLYVSYQTQSTEYPGWLISCAVTALSVCLIGLVVLIYALAVNSLNLGIASMFIMAASFAGLSLALRVGEGIRNSGNP